MKKIAIVGCPGSGKSTFARALSKEIEIPVFHLDNIFWREDKTFLEEDEFLKKLSEVIEKDTWIIDGNYSSSMEMRFKSCDTIFFLDYPTQVCIEGVESRIGKKRDDIPWIEEKIDDEFIDFIKKYYNNKRPYVIELLEKYKNKQIIIFKTREEANEYLLNLINKEKLVI